MRIFMVLIVIVTLHQTETLANDKGIPWGPEQTTGKPDTKNDGRFPTTWAPRPITKDKNGNYSQSHIGLDLKYLKHRCVQD